MTEADQAELRRLIAWLDRVWAASVDDRETIAALQKRVSELELIVDVHRPDPPVTPPASRLPLVPFTMPPLLLNRGSWDRNDGQDVRHEALQGVLRVHVGQVAQAKERVIRRDWGLQDPALEPGRGGMLREPAGRLRRYELSVFVPEDYNSDAEVCTVFQFHTSSAKDPPYLSWMLWSTTSRWRHNQPDGGRVDHEVKPIKRGNWYDLAVEARWSKGSDGILKAWEDGRLVVDERGANFRKEEDDAPYLVFGCYYPSAIKAFSNTLDFARLRIGDIP